MKLYSSIKKSISVKDLEGPHDTPRYPLGTRIKVIKDFEESPYAQEWIYCRATSDIGTLDDPLSGKGRPHMIGKEFGLENWSRTFNPDMTVVVCSTWSIMAGQYSFVLFRGETEVRIEGSDELPATRFLKAEGDITKFGNTGFRTAYSVGFLTETRPAGATFSKGCLFGIQTNTSNTTEEDYTYDPATDD